MDQLQEPAGTSPPRRPIYLALLLIAFIFASVAPTLTWLEFSSGSENLNVATVLEMKRVNPATGQQGPWLIPTLKGAPRLIKPPLTAWLTASLVGDETVANLSTADPAARKAAYARLAWQIRWPALLCSCLMLLAVYDLGATLAGSRAGLLALGVAGTNLLFLRYGRSATTDVQLMLWVTVTNALLARAIFRGQRWLGCTVGGLALGLAFMSKGPVALAQSVVPILIAAPFAARWARKATAGTSHIEPARPSWLGPILMGILAMLAVGLPWYAYVMYTTPNITSAWLTEVTREGATDLPDDPFYQYIVLIPLMLPWMVFFVVGLIMCWQQGRKGNARSTFALALAVLPVVIMSFFKDKPDRYLLPMVGAAAVVTAIALVKQTAPFAERNREDNWLAMAQWMITIVLALAAPLAGRYVLRQANVPEGGDGPPWYTFTQVGWMIPAMLGALIIGAIATRRFPLVGATFCATLAMNAIFLVGYRHSYSGLSEMKPLADEVWQRYPQSAVYFLRPRSKAQPVDLAIYTNRLIIETNDLTSVPPRDVPNVAVVFQRRDEPPPQWPAGWTPYQAVEWEVDEKRRFWHAGVQQRQELLKLPSTIQMSFRAERNAVQRSRGIRPPRPQGEEPDSSTALRYARNDMGPDDE